MFPSIRSMMEGSLDHPQLMHIIIYIGMIALLCLSFPGALNADQQPSLRLVSCTLYQHLAPCITWYQGGNLPCDENLHIFKVLKS